MFKGEEAVRTELCERVTCSRTLRKEGGCRKGCSGTVGLCPEGDVDPGLKKGHD